MVIVVIFWIHYLPQTASQNPTTTNSASVIESGPAHLYPNHQLTPGGILPVDASQVCVPGYSKSVRNVPVEEKKQVYSEYGITYPEPRGSFEVDHFISLELGGSNDIQNLWPEPAEPRPGFHEKDAVENYLHSQVCSGAITLVEAQKEISTDWYAVYTKITH